MTAHSLPDQTRAAMRIEVDTIRAIVCFILVLHHMVGISPDYGLELPWENTVSIVSHTTQDMRMPIFSFISGMVFARATGLLPDARTVIRKKARRLLLPMAVVGSLFWLARFVTGGDPMPYPMIFVTSFAHYWFLQASFLIMTAFVLLTCVFGGPHHKTVALGLGALGILWWGFAILPFPMTNWFSIVNAVFLLPFFMSGYLLTQTPELRQKLRTHPLARSVGAALLVIGLVIGWNIATHNLDLTGLPRRLIAIYLGFSACFGLIMLRLSSGFLARIGAYSYAIYLFHVFFTALTTKLWHATGQPIPLLAIVILGLMLGTGGPMILQNLILRWPLAGAACLGLPLDKLRARKLATQPSGA
ncbi:acyltransferase family protein [Shimia aestuarii]|uniref:Fucose 4-O-acetylase n=1 Tax=Shimia aestuarii TaxID=254406 RepID=A0A1I4RGI6_9RHOB|nr:acyltransferase [Shimia aestuarii]SFM51361.1 Fucose 4-O-acetylase [Shimia aestuarii]